MRFKYSNALLIALAVVLAAVVLIAPDAHAQSYGSSGTDPLTNAGNQIVYVYQSLRRIIYIVGGIGVIILATFAFFGKFKWMWFWALAGGIFLVATTASLISWLGGDSTGISPN